MAANLCRNGHDLDVVGSRANGNGCNECKREASRRYRERRAAGEPMVENRRHVRTDLGYNELKVSE